MIGYEYKTGGPQPGVTTWRKKEGFQRSCLSSHTVNIEGGRGINVNHASLCSPPPPDFEAADPPLLRLGLDIGFRLNYYGAAFVAAARAACASPTVYAGLSPAQDHSQTAAGPLPSLVLHQFAQVVAHTPSKFESVEFNAVHQLAGVYGEGDDGEYADIGQGTSREG